jgi:uncharacterized protein (TIGR04255 family)
VGRSMPILEKLPSPPITEVVCGIGFDPLPGFDALLMGVYWDDVRDRYPKRQLLPALSDEPGIVLGGSPPLRAWFISEDDVFLIQLQHDRFYLNWRARGGEYPRFSERAGSPGLVSKLMDEYSHFQEFVENRFQRRAVARYIELAKVDLLLEGRHWDGFEDLAKLVPWLHPTCDFSQSPDPAVVMRFSEPREKGRWSVSLDTGMTQQPGKPAVRLLKLETRISCSATGDTSSLREEFVRANDEINSVFASLIPEAERKSRFT